MLMHLKSKLVNTFKAKKKIWLILPFAAIILMLFIVPSVIVIVAALRPAFDVRSGLSSTVAENFKNVDLFVAEKIWKSFWIAIVSTFICLILAFPFCYFLAFVKSKVFKSTVILFATAPIWSSFLIKLIGLKTLFDLLAGHTESTYGDIFTIIGIVYMYIPFMFLPLYTVLIHLPKNFILASKDLGRNAFQSFFLIVIPYCKTAIISGLTLVLLPGFTTVAIPEFLNNYNNASLIGDYIFNLGNNAIESELSAAQSSAVSLVLALVILAAYSLWVLIPKGWKILKHKLTTGSFFHQHKPNKKSKLLVLGTTVLDQNIGDKQ